MEYNLDNNSLKHTAIYQQKDLLQYSLLIGNNTMAFNLASFEADLSSINILWILRQNFSIHFNLIGKKEMMTFTYQMSGRTTMR